MNSAEYPEGLLPTFSARRLQVFATGSINAALLPYWLNWARTFYPTLTVSVGISRSASRFVSREAVSRLASGPVFSDEWDDPELPEGSHRGIDAGADCYAMFPATLDSVMRLAGGRSDSPMLMALQLTTKPIGIAATFPRMNEVIQEQIDRLLRRPNVVFSGEVPAFSVSKENWSGTTGFFLPALFEAMEPLVSASSD